MNAAFLLVTSAWLAGADPAPPPTNPATAPAVSSAPAPLASSSGCGGCGSCANSYSSCGSCSSCSSCGSCCEEKEGFFSRLRNKFSRNKCEEPCSTCSSCTSCATQVHTACECECDPCAKKFGGRLRNLFSKHHDDCGCDNGCNSCGSSCGGCSSCGNGTSYNAASPAGIAPNKMPPAGEPIKAPKDAAPAKELPKGTTAAPALDVTPTSSKQIIEETKNPFELDRRYETRVNRAADYSWLTGQLSYVHTDGGLWVLRYAPIGKEEVNGGSVVLARDVSMDSYREGDLVTVHGDILQQKASPSLGGPLYRVQSIQLMDRPGQ